MVNNVQWRAHVTASWKLLSPTDVHVCTTPPYGDLAYCAAGDKKEEMAEGDSVEGGTLLRRKEGK